MKVARYIIPAILILVCSIIVTIGFYIFFSEEQSFNDVKNFSIEDLLDTEVTLNNDDETTNSNFETDVDNDNANSTNLDEQVVITGNDEILESAWIANWDQTSGMNSYKITPDRFNSISPTWYYLTPTGTLATKSGARDTTIINTLKKDTSTKLIPTIRSGNSTELSSMINDQTMRKNFINEVLSEIAKYEYDGIDIDFESIKSSDKDAFSKFIKELSEAIHKNDKLLTIAILPKDSDIFDLIMIEGVGGVESRTAQDWEEIGKYVDEFRIMSYDYSHSSGQSGPIAPYDWLESILEFAVDKVDPNKIMLGLPLYGYKWEEGSKGSTAIIYTNVQNILNSNKEIIENKLDPEYKEKYLKYKDGTKTYEVWYQDSEVNEVRLELAKNYDIKGVVYWRLGGEDL